MEDKQLEHLVEVMETAVSVAVKTAISDAMGRCSNCHAVCELTPHQHRDAHKNLLDIGLGEHTADHIFIREAREAVKEGKKQFVIAVFKYLSAAGAGGIAAATINMLMKGAPPSP